MLQTGLTSTALANIPKSGERTSPSPQPPSLTTEIKPSAFNGASTPSESPNDYPGRAASSAPKCLNATDSQETQIEIVTVPVVRPEVPECYPNDSYYLVPIQEWAGRVIAIADDTFDARLRDLTNGGREVATIGLNEISREDRAELQVGSLFHWVIGQETVSGTLSNVSRIVFLNSPRLTKRDLEAGQQWADRLRAKWKLD